MARIIIILLIAVSAAVFFLGGSPTAEETVHTTNYPTRQQLQQAARDQSSWLLVYSAGKAEQAERYRLLLQEVAKNPPRRRTIEVRALADTPDSLLGKSPTLLIGTGWSAEWLTQLSTLPAIDLQKKAFRLGKETFRAKDDLLKAMYLPNPWQPQLPLHLITGNSDEALLDVLEDSEAQDWSAIFWSSWGYELRQNQQLRYLGFFNDSTWVMDRKMHYEFDPTPELILETPVARFLSYDSLTIANEQARLMADFSHHYQAIQAFALAEDSPQLHCYFYPSVEQKALRTSNMRQAHCKPDALSVHLVHNTYFQAEEWGEQYRPLFRHWLGQPAALALEEGLLFQWCYKIRGRHWREWAADLITSNSILPLEQLLDQESFTRDASLLPRFSSALWVDFLLQEWGHARFIERYANWEASPAAIAQLKPRWEQYLAEQRTTDAVVSPPYDGPFLKGFTLAHEGYRVYNGYGSASARKSLEALAAIGNKAVAIVPYSYMRNPQQPMPIPVSDHAGSENDEAVLFSHFSAQDMGQFTLLKPQIWVGGGWPGDIDFDTEEEWQAFFRYYGNWIKHYALLAELYGFNALCIGTELKQTTLKRPAEWRQLIREIRAIYRGTLTYAANWGEECEQLNFWSELDFIGINCYYPLSKEDNPTDDELEAAVERVMDKLERIHQKADRPVWFTEIGFRSAEHPWKSPHEEAGQRAIDEKGQARCYDIMLQQVQQNDWINGLFWWKWSAYLPHVEDRGRGYMPYGKEAGAVLEQHYLNWK